MLAIIDVPELEKQVERNAALVLQAQARVKQMKAKVTMADAEVTAAEAEIDYAKAFAKSAKAWVVYRGTVFKRMQELAVSKSVEQKIEDEAKQHYEAAKESENAAKAAITKAEAKAISADAKVPLAIADLDEAEAQVKVAQAELEKTQEQFKFSRIIAPFKGHITERFLIEGAFVRSAAEGGAAQTILSIQSPDKMRMVVQIPDNDAPYAIKDKPAKVEIDAFPGVEIKAKISALPRPKT